MTVQALPIAGSWEVRPKVFGDARGAFSEQFTAASAHEILGRHFEVAQVNLSTSAAGTIRGVHFADVPPGQAKYVWCTAGAALDVVVDLRVGSPTFGRWHAVRLGADRNAVLISEGLGHAFVALEDCTAVTYLCNAPYTPQREHSVSPFDADLAIDWPELGRPWIVSDRDRAAPSLAQAERMGILPRWPVVLDTRTAG